MPLGAFNLVCKVFGSGTVIGPEEFELLSPKVKSCGTAISDRNLIRTEGFAHPELGIHVSFEK